MEERRPKAMRTKEQRPRTSWEEMTMTKLTRNAGRHHAILGILWKRKGRMKRKLEPKEKNGSKTGGRRNV
jgi:hypothetical protein